MTTEHDDGVEVSDRAVPHDGTAGYGGSSRTRGMSSMTADPGPPAPPTTPCSVVWSRGRPYVLESGAGRPRWMGTDHHGRPQALTGEELRRRGWSYRRST